MSSNLLDHLPPDLRGLENKDAFVRWLGDLPIPWHFKKRYLFEWGRRFRVTILREDVVLAGADKRNGE